MTILQAVTLGILQGFTEFLPVSSSAHLVIVQHFFGLSSPSLLVFDVTVHVGTLAAILVYFRKDLFPLPKFGRRMIFLIVIASIPTAFIGFALKDWVEESLSFIRPVSIALIVNSFLLWSTVKCPAQKKNASVWDAFFIGIIQGIAVLPGISRSGSTITAAFWRSWDRREAARFSFFIAIPAILGATVLVLPKGIAQMPQGHLSVLAAGFLAAFASGFIAIKILFRVILQGKFHYFAAYTFLVGLVTLVLSFVL